MKKLLSKGGAAGKSQVVVSAGNDAPKGQASMPTGIGAARRAAASVEIQIITDAGGTTLAVITRQESNLFEGK